MPQPALTPWLADFTSDSSTEIEVEAMDSKYKIGKIAAGGKGLAQASLDETPGQSKLLKEVELMFGEVHRRPSESVFTIPSF